MEGFFSENKISLASIIQLFNQAPVAMLLLQGPELIIEAVNPQMLAIIDKKENIIGKHFTSVLPELIEQGYVKLLQNTFQTGQTYKGIKESVFIERKNQLSEGFYDFTYSPLYDGQTKEITGVCIIAYEVSENVEVEKKLKNTEENFRDVIDNTLYSSGIFSGCDMHIELVNDGLLGILSKKREDVVGKSLLNILPELKEQDFYEQYTRALSSDQTIKIDGFEIMINTDYGLQKFYYNVCFKPINNWQIIGKNAIIITIVNVTELVVAREQLQEKELLLRNFIESVPAAINIFDGRDLIYAISNSISPKIWGFEGKIGQKLLDHVPRLIQRELYQNLIKVLDTGQQISKKKHNFIDEAGNSRYVNYIFQPIKNSKGEVQYVMTMGYDIMEELEAEEKLRQSEEKFRTLAEFTPQIIWSADADWNINYFNQSWYNYTGINELPSKAEVKSLIRPDNLSIIREKWLEAISNESPFEAEIFLASKENPGDYKCFLSRAVPLKDNSGKINTWIGTCTDIDQFKKIQKYKDDFLAIASHELKTPLTTIKLFAHYIESNLSITNDIINLDAIKKLNFQINKLTNLISDLFDITKLQSGQLNLRMSSFDFDNLLTQIIEEHQMSCSSPILIESETIGEIISDQSRLEQVMSNLISNAIKYSDTDKPIQITVKKNKTGISETSLLFSVTDQGSGIAPEHLKEIFTQYYRIQPEGNKVSGMGLGLFICSEIIKQFNGKIHAKSKIGKGSTFSFEIPLYNN